jgi:hypothetical protein
LKKLAIDPNKLHLPIACCQLPIELTLSPQEGFFIFTFGSIAYFCRALAY